MDFDAILKTYEKDEKKDDDEIVIDAENDDKDDEPEEAKSLDDEPKEQSAKETLEAQGKAVENEGKNDTLADINRKIVPDEHDEKDVSLGPAKNPGGKGLIEKDTKDKGSVGIKDWYKFFSYGIGILGIICSLLLSA
eukprot:CAMPEP_0168347878 /NCGR_PEP_ID=MMETSP0213-20121227/19319_1 /TAXON_ID=151035 /ORGANISM="Euplotes harpa, Strain FSP1.4" /LENGTH=136 /DNA_ID=CAMNT_0008357185 /DNA_START=378 /DNA_END=788 /DNA_ORIENTATION=+